MCSRYSNMKEFVIHLVSSFSPEWAVFFLSMVPITELRASIPIGIGVYGMGAFETWLIAVAGNLLPVVVTLWIFPWLHDWLVGSKIFGPHVSKKLKQAEDVFKGNYAKYGALALVLFVGIPLPFTGAWTGSLAAFIFNIPFKKAFPLITIGVMMAATLVTAITLFAGGALRALLGA
jgi:uncharacterized membrane protein